jgi:hypothetical protein
MKNLLINFLIICFLPIKSFAISKECESALKILFQEKITKNEAAQFLQLQGDLTLHRLAWAFLKKQSGDQNQKLESIQDTIIELLNDKYTNSNPDFVKARKLFEDQPLSRTALAEISPYLKEFLSAEFKDSEELYKLNMSDLKLLSALAKKEKETANNGKFDYRMLDSESPNGMLNFLTLINSSYRLNQATEEDELNVEAQLKGIENLMISMQKKIADLLDRIDLPENCIEDTNCNQNEKMHSFFNLNEDVQKLFWDSLADKLMSDDLLLEKLSYGDLWLKVKSLQPFVPVNSNNTSKNKSTRNSSTLSTTSNHQSFSPKVKKTSTQLKPIEPSLIDETGLIIEDPIGIIVRDKTGRERANWQSFGKDYLKAMAQAIVADDKVFMHDNRLYDRKNGRAISEDEALAKFPPEKRKALKSQLVSNNPKLRLQQIKAMVNGDKVFLMNDKVYDLNGKSQNPAKLIAEEMSKKLTLTISSSRYEGMGQDYLSHRAEALKNNKPYFIVGQKTYDSFSGRELASPFRKPAGDAKIDKNKRKLYENLSDAELIINYNRDMPNKNCGYYGIVDKRKAVFSIYSTNGTKIFSSETLIGVNKSDERTRWLVYSDEKRTPSASTGSGIFTVRPQDLEDAYNKKYFNNNIVSFKDEKNQNTVFAVHQVPVGMSARYQKFGTSNPDDRRISGGCANVKLTDYQKIKEYLKPNCQVYVLPEEENNKFIVRDGEIKLISTKPVDSKKSNLYNYSSNDTKVHPIKIKINNTEANTQVAREFAKALEDEKEKLMKIYKLSNDEYNDLAMLAFGILGNESKFGTSTKLSIKENAQFAVIVARLVKTGDIDQATNTSRGVTQIKFLPEGPFKKNYPEVSKDNLMNPRNAAVATVAYLAEAAKQMRSIALENKSDPSKLRITTENMMDFMGYLYQGARKSLTTDNFQKQATPEYNAYYRSLQRNMSFIEISQDLSK